MFCLMCETGKNVIPRWPLNLVSLSSVTYRNQKPLDPAYIGENAADARNG